MPAKRVYTTEHIKEGIRAYYTLKNFRKAYFHEHNKVDVEKESQNNLVRGETYQVVRDCTNVMVLK